MLAFEKVPTAYKRVSKYLGNRDIKTQLKILDYMNLFWRCGASGRSLSSCTENDGLAGAAAAGFLAAAALASVHFPGFRVFSWFLLLSVANAQSKVNRLHVP